MRIVKAAIVILALSAPLAGQPVARPELFTLEVTDSKDPVVAGEEVTYTITIVNLAEGPIESPRLFLRSHNGLKLGDLEAPGLRQSPRWEDTVIHAEGTAIPEGGRLVATVKGTPVRAGDGTVYLEVEARGWEGDRSSGEVRSVEATRVTVPPGAQPPGNPPNADVRIVDLSLSIADSGDPVSEGEEYQYAITVTNGGTTQIDSFYVALDLEGCTLADTNWSTVGTRRGGPLAPGASVTLPARVRAGEAGTALAEAHIGYHLDLDLDESDDRATETTSIRAGGAPAPAGFESFVDPAGEKPVDLVLTVRDSKDVVENGEKFEIEIVVANDLPVEAPDVKVEVILPEGVQLLGIQEEGNFPSVVKTDGEKITFPLSGRTGRSRVVLPVRANVPAGGTVNTRVRVTSSGRELDDSDNARTEPTTITPKPPAEVPISMLDLPGSRPVATTPGANDPLDLAPQPPTAPSPPLASPAEGGLLAGVTPYDAEGNLFTGTPLRFASAPGGPALPDLDMRFDAIGFSNAPGVDWLLEMINAGSAPASGVGLHVALPSQVTVKTAQTPQGSCTTSGSTAQCDIGSILPGSKIPITFGLSTDATTGGALTGTATATLNERDADPSNNQKPIRIDITPAPPPPPQESADLSVAGTATPSPFTIGSTGTFRFEVRNGGPGTARTITTILDMPLPPHTPVPTGCETDAATRIRCATDALANGSTAVFQVSATIPSGAASSLSATAAVSASTPDPSPANNQTSVTVPVQQPAASADLQLTTNAVSSVQAGGTIRYFHTAINNGPSPATGVVVTNVFDANATFVTCSPTCTPPGADRVVRCTVPTMAPNTTGQVFVDVRAPASGTVVNQASVAGAEPDPNAGNNATTTSTSVIPAAPACALGIAPGTYQGDGGCGASGAGTVSCASSAEVKIQHPALNLTCNASGNCGDANTVFGVPNHRCAVQLISGVVLVHCDQLSGGAPTGASCDQRFTKP